MKTFRLLLLVLVVSISGSAFAQLQKPVSEVTHAVIISVDGMRNDLALRANMPNLRKMLDRGTFTFWARSTELSITLPTHTSMLTGVPPEVHGILFNDDGPAEPVHPKVPSIFDYAKRAGYTTAMATGKSKLALIPQHPELVDYMAAPARGKGGNNLTATADAVSIIKEHRPGLLFLHLTKTDAVGHGIGWGTPEQMATFEEADKCIGQVLDAIEDQKLTDSTVVILTADHGGRQKWHGANDPRARYIPWIVVGPGIRAGLDLDTIRGEQVNIEDTFATACTMLGIQTDGEIKGKMVWEVLQNPPSAAVQQAVPAAK
jgi:predicted AlkP superfamily pyrophosphatase or phosphodiesterase